MITRWNRCTEFCGCADRNKRDANCKCRQGCERGSADRSQLRRYAADVLVAMGMWDGFSTSAICPLTGMDFDIRNGEVDKANPAIGYVPGNVVLVSRAGNQERAKLQQHYSDLPQLARYVGDVASAGIRTVVLRKRDVMPIPSGGYGMDPARDMAHVRFGPYGH